MVCVAREAGGATAGMFSSNLSHLGESGILHPPPGCRITEILVYCDPIGFVVGWARNDRGGMMGASLSQYRLTLTAQKLEASCRFSLFETASQK